MAAFILAGLALAGLAWVVSFATEQLGGRFGPAVTGLMQSTLGNLPEFFVVIFALQAGEVVVAETAILGSILVNALLVLGLAIIVGARREKDGIMRFSPRLPNDTATLLLIASFIIVLVGLADPVPRSGQPSHPHDLDHRGDRDPGRVRGVGASVPDHARDRRKPAPRGAARVDDASR